MTQSRFARVLRAVNLPYKLCHHMMGHKHSTAHRMIVGIAVMVCGVLIAKEAEHFLFYPVQVGADLLGYGVHGLGLTPFIEAMLEKFAESAT